MYTISYGLGYNFLWFLLGIIILSVIMVVFRKKKKNVKALIICGFVLILLYIIISLRTSMKLNNTIPESVAISETETTIDETNETISKDEELNNVFQKYKAGVIQNTKDLDNSTEMQKICYDNLKTAIPEIKKLTSDNWSGNEYYQDFVLSVGYFYTHYDSDSIQYKIANLGFDVMRDFPKGHDEVIDNINSIEYLLDKIEDNNSIAETTDKYNVNTETVPTFENQETLLYSDENVIINYIKTDIDYTDWKKRYAVTFVVKNNTDTTLAIQNYLLSFDGISLGDDDLGFDEIPPHSKGETKALYINIENKNPSKISGRIQIYDKEGKILNPNSYYANFIDINVN